MSLLSSAMQKCVFMHEQTAPDPQGGFTITWTDGAEFDAAIVFDSSIQARAEHRLHGAMFSPRGLTLGGNYNVSFIKRNAEMRFYA